MWRGVRVARCAALSRACIPGGSLDTSRAHSLRGAFSWRWLGGTGRIAWSQATDELDELVPGQVTFTVPEDCPDGEYPYPEVQIQMSTKEGGLGYGRTIARVGEGIPPEGAQRQHGTFTDSMGFFGEWLAEPTSGASHVVTAEAAQHCDGGEDFAGHVSVDSISFDVIGAR